ncbi:hypothetical protein [Tropicimonas marinistellae]|uniref:hypothetical protein n=1 Tax=Tropicimonas marinistellae TaxID=1739787 RepID=UPI0008371777|nr:hypothetical protein [Tropicimonas marinistellae]
MATKAELEAELEKLRAEMAARPEPALGAKASSEQTRTEAAETALDRFLSDHDLKIDDFENLLKRLSEEVGGLPQHKPILTALGAFALGFFAGRMSK